MCTDNAQIIHLPYVEAHRCSCITIFLPYTRTALLQTRGSVCTSLYFIVYFWPWKPNLLILIHLLFDEYSNTYVTCYDKIHNYLHTPSYTARITKNHTFPESHKRISGLRFLGPLRSGWPFREKKKGPMALMLGSAAWRSPGCWPPRWTLPPVQSIETKCSRTSRQKHSFPKAARKIPSTRRQLGVSIIGTHWKNPVDLGWETHLYPLLAACTRIFGISHGTYPVQ